jgi:SAM-dependent methyltransferase
MSVLSNGIGFFQRKANLGGEWRATFLSLLEKKPDDRLLDLGCYQGDFTLAMASKIGTGNIVGVDALEETKNDVEKKGIKFYKVDLNDKFPFDNDSFDVITASQIIEHISNTDMFLREIHRVVTDKGYVVISTPNLAAFFTAPLLFLGWQPLTAHVSDEIPWAGTHPALREKGEPLITLWHRRCFTIRALEELLKYHGFEIEKTIGSAKLICRIDKRHSTIITVKARRKIKN